MFVGGSLVPAGGHNILEPAVYGKPIVFGPYMQNFRRSPTTFLANGAAIKVRYERELEDTMLSLIGDPVRRARLGAAARALVEANRGAKDKTLAVIADLLPLDRARRGPPFPRSPLTGEHADRARCSAAHTAASRRAAPGTRAVRTRRRRLRHPVISVGNLAVGGSGKTPAVRRSPAAA